MTLVETGSMAPSTFSKFSVHSLSCLSVLMWLPKLRLRCCAFFSNWSLVPHSRVRRLK